MRTATVREVQHNPREVLSWVSAGEEVRVMRRNKMVARLLPPSPDVAESPDFVGRARAIWGDHPRGRKPSKLISDARGER
jgi:antitoxin (DNA-binding transcriptional repressor) of toxin-antitoxin stability system